MYRYITLFDKPDKFIFKKRGLKALFWANCIAATCRILKNATFRLAEKILLIYFVKISKLNVFARHLLAEN